MSILPHEPLFRNEKNQALMDPIVFSPEKYYYEPPCDFKKFEKVDHSTI